MKIILNTLIRVSDVLSARLETAGFNVDGRVILCVDGWADWAYQQLYTRYGEV